MTDSITSETHFSRHVVENGKTFECQRHLKVYHQSDIKYILFGRGFKCLSTYYEYNQKVNGILIINLNKNIIVNKCLLFVRLIGLVFN